MDPAHHDEHNTLRVLLSLLAFADVCLLLALLLGQNVSVWIYGLCKLLLYAILLDDRVWHELCYK